MQSLRVHLAVMHDVDVRLVDRQNVPLSRVCAQRHRTVDAGDSHAVARLDCIHEVVVRKHDDRVRRLTRRHVLWSTTHVSGRVFKIRRKFSAKFTNNTHPFNGPFSGTTRVSRYQKNKTNLDFTEARDSGIICAICNPAPSSRQITMPAPHHSSFLQAGCPFSRPTNSVKAHRPFSRTLQEIPCVSKSTRISRTRWSKKKLNWSIHSIRKLMTSWHTV